MQCLNRNLLPIDAVSQSPKNPLGAIGKFSSATRVLKLTHGEGFVLFTRHEHYQPYGLRSDISAIVLELS